MSNLVVLTGHRTVAPHVAGTTLRTGKSTTPRDSGIRIVLSVLAGEVTIAEASRKESVSEVSISRWRNEFLDAGKQALTTGRDGPSSREQQLLAEVQDLTQALGEAAVELRVWKKSAENRLGPSKTSR